MAAHRGHDEWLRSSRSHVVAHFAHDERKIVDAAAARRNCDVRAGTNDRVERRQLRLQRGARIVETGVIETLPDFGELNHRHSPLKYRESMLRDGTSAPEWNTLFRPRVFLAKSRNFGKTDGRSVPERY